MFDVEHFDVEGVPAYTASGASRACPLCELATNEDTCFNCGEPTRSRQTVSF